MGAARRGARGGGPEGVPGCGGGPPPPAVSAHGPPRSFAERMVFVGFKGSFRPAWVALDTSDHHAKVFEAVPIPVVRKKTL